MSTRNIKIGLSEKDKLNMKNEIYDKVSSEVDKGLKVSGTDLANNILAFTENKGIYVATDTGGWYYWKADVSKYVYGGVFQATELADGSVTNEKLANESVTEEKLNGSVKAQYKNLESANEDVTFNYDEKKANSYEVNIPVKSLPYAKLNKLGGKSILSEFENLLKLDDVKETTKNNVVYSVKDGIITLNGVVATAFGVDFNVKDNVQLIAGTYTCIDVSESNNLTGLNVYVNFTDGTNFQFGQNTSFKTFTLTETKALKNIGAWLSVNTNFNLRKIKLMLVRGENKPTKYSYGKYLHGKVTNIRTIGKNLFSLKDVSETTINGVTYSVKDGVVTLNGYCNNWTGIKLYLNNNLTLGNQTYTLCELNKQPSSCGLYVDTESGNIFNITNLTNYNFEQTKNFLEENVVTNISIGVPVGEYNNVKFKPMLVIGENVPTQFEAYKENIYSIPEEVLSLNGYGQSNPDDISEYNYIDFENKQFVAVGSISNDKWTSFPAPILTDISRYINCYLEVSGGGNIIFENAPQLEVYSDITFLLKKEITLEKDKIYEKTTLPILYLTGSTLGISKEDKVNLNYVYGDLSGTCTLKWQGSSSLAYPKKNYTIKFDNPFEAKEGWGSQSKYCLKANYIDYTHSRNVVSARLWGQVVKSRTNVPTELSSLVNGGAIDGFPICVVINGEYQGLYTFNIPKDGWMFGMGSLDTEAIVGAGAMSDITGFKAPPEFGDDKFEIEYAPNEDDTSEIETSITNLYNALQNATKENFDSSVGSLIDIESAIDYCLFVVLLNHFDGTNRNYLMATFDNTKWYMSAYDMDCTYGLNWNGSKVTQPKDYQIDFNNYIKKNKLIECICNYKKEELKARYKTLRNDILNKNNVALQFLDFISNIPKLLYDEEVKIWTKLPSTSINNANQIIWYFTERCEYVDLWVDRL